MGDSTVIKVDSAHSPTGAKGERYLASGKSVSMRLWDETSQTSKDESTVRDYEVVGYVIEGSADLEIEGQTVHLETGSSWVVPKGSKHKYTIKEHFKAVEATAPPAQVHGRSD